MNENIKTENLNNIQTDKNVSETTPAQAKTETVETKVETKPIETNDDIFISENDQFECVIQYYKVQNDIMVKNVDENFDNTVPCKTITFKCKYPSQADYQALINSSAYKNINENITGIDLSKIEMTRFSLLIRSWSVNKPLDRLIDVDPKIIRGMLLAVNNVIGLKGMF